MQYQYSIENFGGRTLEVFQENTYMQVSLVYSFTIQNSIKFIIM